MLWSRVSLLGKTEIWYTMHPMAENDFWQVCEALDCERRIELLRILLSEEKAEFPCVNELAERMGLSCATVSVHLKKLYAAGLVSSKRADRRVYYRVFATTDGGARIVEALRKLFAERPCEERLRQFRGYAHALSHERRNAIVRCLHAEPGLPLLELAKRTDMPPQTADRLWGELNKAHVIDLNGRIVMPAEELEETLLELTLA